MENEKRCAQDAPLSFFGQPTDDYVEKPVLTVAYSAAFDLAVGDSKPDIEQLHFSLDHKFIAGVQTGQHRSVFWVPLGNPASSFTDETSNGSQSSNLICAPQCTGRWLWLSPSRSKRNCQVLFQNHDLPPIVKVGWMQTYPAPRSMPSPVLVLFHETSCEENAPIVSFVRLNSLRSCCKKSNTSEVHRSHLLLNCKSAWKPILYWVPPNSAARRDGLSDVFVSGQSSPKRCDVVSITSGFLERVWQASGFDHCPATSWTIDLTDHCIGCPSVICLRHNTRYISLSATDEGFCLVSSFRLLLSIGQPLCAYHDTKLRSKRLGKDASLHNSSVTVAAMYLRSEWIFSLILDTSNFEKQQVYIFVTAVTGVTLFAVPLLSFSPGKRYNVGVFDNNAAVTFAKPLFVSHDLGTAYVQLNYVPLTNRQPGSLLVRLAEFFKLIVWRSQCTVVYPIEPLREEEKPLLLKMKRLDARWRIAGHRLYMRLVMLRGKQRDAFNHTDWAFESWDMVTLEDVNNTYCGVFDLNIPEQSSLSQILDWESLLYLDDAGFNMIFSDVARYSAEYINHLRLQAVGQSVSFGSVYTQPLNVAQRSLLLLPRSSCNVAASRPPFVIPRWKCFADDSRSYPSVGFIALVQLLPGETLSPPLELLWAISTHITALKKNSGTILENASTELSTVMSFTVHAERGGVCRLKRSSLYQHCLKDQILVYSSTASIEGHFCVVVESLTARNKRLRLMRLLPHPYMLKTALLQLCNQRAGNVARSLAKYNGLHANNLPLWELELGLRLFELKRVKEAFQSLQISLHTLKIAAWHRATYGAERVVSFIFTLPRKTDINGEALPAFFECATSLLERNRSVDKECDDDLLGYLKNNSWTVLFGTLREYWAKHKVFYRRLVSETTVFIARIIGASNWLEDGTAICFGCFQPKTVDQEQAGLVVLRLAQKLELLRRFQTYWRDNLELSAYEISCEAGETFFASNNFTTRGVLECQAQRQLWSNVLQKAKCDTATVFTQLYETLVDGRLSLLLQRFGMSLQLIRWIGCRLAFRILWGSSRPESLREAMTLVRSLGLSITEFCRTVIWESTHRSLRSRLSQNLRRLKCLFLPEQKLLTILRLLEEEYLSPCFSTELHTTWTATTLEEFPVDLHYRRLPFIKNDTVLEVPGGSFYPPGGQLAFFEGLKTNYSRYPDSLSHRFPETPLHSMYAYWERAVFLRTTQNAAEAKGSSKNSALFLAPEDTTDLLPQGEANRYSSATLSSKKHVNEQPRSKMLRKPLQQKSDYSTVAVREIELNKASHHPSHHNLSDLLVPSQITSDAVAVLAQFFIGDVEDLALVPVKPTETFQLDVGQHSSATPIAWPPSSPDRGAQSEFLTLPLEAQISAGPLNESADAESEFTLRKASYASRHRGPSATRSFHILNGYMQLCLRWVGSWTTEEIARIFLERNDPLELLDLALHDNDVRYNNRVKNQKKPLFYFWQLIRSSTQIAFQQVLTATVNYAVDHHDWRSLLRWFWRVRYLKHITEKRKRTHVLNSTVMRELQRTLTIGHGGVHPLTSRTVLSELDSDVAVASCSNVLQTLKHVAYQFCITEASHRTLQPEILAQLQSLMMQLFRCYTFAHFGLMFLRYFRLAETYSDFKKMVLNDNNRSIQTPRILPSVTLPTSVLYLGQLGPQFHLLTSLHHAGCLVQPDCAYRDADNLRYVNLDAFYDVLNDPLAFLGTLQFLPSSHCVSVQLLASFSKKLSFVCGSTPPVLRLPCPQFWTSIEKYPAILDAYKRLPLERALDCVGTSSERDDQDAGQQLTKIPLQSGNISHVRTLPYVAETLSLWSTLHQAYRKTSSGWPCHRSKGVLQSCNFLDQLAAHQNSVLWTWDYMLPTLSNDATVIGVLNEILHTDIPEKLPFLLLPQPTSFTLSSVTDENDLAKTVVWALPAVENHSIDYNKKKQPAASCLSPPGYSEHAVRLTLDVRYYLSQESPCFAFFCAIAQPLSALPDAPAIRALTEAIASVGSQYAVAGCRLRVSTIRDEEEIKRFYKDAYDVAFANLFHDRIVLATVLFLDLLRIDSSALKIDVHAARRIYSYRNQNAVRVFGCSRTSKAESALLSLSADDPQFDTKPILGLIANLFLSLPRTPTQWPYADQQQQRQNVQDGVSSLSTFTPDVAQKPGDELLTVLRLLEEATADAESSDFSCGAYSKEGRWSLVTAFCHAHNLPQSLTVLHELGRKNDWLHFLLEAGRQNCSEDTVGRILAVDNFFSDTALRKHLCISLTLTRNSCDTYGGSCDVELLRQIHYSSSASNDLELSSSVIPAHSLPEYGLFAPNSSNKMLVNFFLACRKPLRYGDPLFFTGFRLLRWSLITSCCRAALYGVLFATPPLPLFFLAALYTFVGENMLPVHTPRLQCSRSCSQEQVFFTPLDTSQRSQSFSNEGFSTATELDSVRFWLQQRFTTLKNDEPADSPSRERDSFSHFSWNFITGRTLDVERCTYWTKDCVLRPLTLCCIFNAQCLGYTDLVYELASIFFSDDDPILLHLLTFHRCFLLEKDDEASAALQRFISSRDAVITALYEALASHEDYSAQCCQWDWRLLTLFDASCKHLFCVKSTQRVKLLTMLHAVRASPRYSHWFLTFKLLEPLETIALNNETLGSWMVDPAEVIDRTLDMSGCFSVARLVLKYWSETLPALYSTPMALRDMLDEGQNKQGLENVAEVARKHICDMQFLPHANVVYFRLKALIFEAISVLNAIDTTRKLCLSCPSLPVYSDSLVGLWIQLYRYLDTLALPPVFSSIFLHHVFHCWKSVLRPRYCSIIYRVLHGELAYLLYIMIRLQKSFGDDVGSNLGRITTLLSLLFTFLVMAFGLFPHQETFDNDVPVMYTLTTNVDVGRLTTWVPDAFLVFQKWPSDADVLYLIDLIPGDLNVSLAPLLESIQLSPQIEFLSTGVTDNEREALKTFAELLPAAFQQKLCCLGQPLPPSSFLTQTDLEQRTDRDVKRQTALSCALSLTQLASSNTSDQCSTATGSNNSDLELQIQRVCVLLWNFGHIETARAIESWCTTLLDHTGFQNITRVLELMYQFVSVMTMRYTEKLSLPDAPLVPRFGPHREIDEDVWHTTEYRDLVSIISHTLNRKDSSLQDSIEKSPLTLLQELDAELHRLLKDSRLSTLDCLNCGITSGKGHCLSLFSQRMIVSWSASYLTRCSPNGIWDVECFPTFCASMMHHIRSQFTLCVSTVLTSPFCVDKSSCSTEAASLDGNRQSVALRGTECKKRCVAFPLLAITPGGLKYAAFQQRPWFELLATCQLFARFIELFNLRHHQSSCDCLITSLMSVVNADNSLQVMLSSSEGSSQVLVEKLRLAFYIFLATLPTWVHEPLLSYSLGHLESFINSCDMKRQKNFHSASLPDILLLGLLCHTSLLFLPNASHYARLEQLLTPPLLHALSFEPPTWLAGLVAYFIGCSGAAFTPQQPVSNIKPYTWAEKLRAVQILPHPAHPGLQDVVQQASLSRDLVASVIKSGYLSHLLDAICPTMVAHTPPISFFCDVTHLWDREAFNPAAYIAPEELRHTVGTHLLRGILSHPSYFGVERLSLLGLITERLGRHNDLGAFLLESAADLLDSLNPNAVNLPPLRASVLNENALIIALETFLKASECFDSGRHPFLETTSTRLAALVAIQLHHEQQALLVGNVPPSKCQDGFRNRTKHLQEMSQVNVLFLDAPSLFNYVVWHPNFSETLAVALPYEQLIYGSAVFHCLWNVTLLTQVIFYGNWEYIRRYIQAYEHLDASMIQKMMHLTGCCIFKEDTPQFAEALYRSFVYDEQLTTDILIPPAPNVDSPAILEILRSTFKKNAVPKLRVVVSSAQNAVIFDRWRQLLDIGCPDYSIRLSTLISLKTQLESPAAAFFSRDAIQWLQDTVNHYRFYLNDASLSTPLALTKNEFLTSTP